MDKLESAFDWLTDGNVWMKVTGAFLFALGLSVLLGYTAYTVSQMASSRSGTKRLIVPEQVADIMWHNKRAIRPCDQIRRICKLDDVA